MLLKTSYKNTYMLNNRYVGIFYLIRRYIDKCKYGKIHSDSINKSDYTEFDSHQYMVWGKKHSGTYLKKLEDKHKEAIEYYCGYGSRDINYYLRCIKSNDKGFNTKELWINMARSPDCKNCPHGRYTTDPPIVEVKNQLDNLIDALSKASPINDNIVVYRAVDKTFIDILIRSNKYSSCGSFVEKGFLSTSLDIDIVKSKCNKEDRDILKIFIPNGSIGIYIDEIKSRGEAEFLLGPGHRISLIDYPYIEHSDDGTWFKMYECKLD